MAKIDGFEIPEEISAELKRMLDAAPVEIILDYAHRSPELAKGFRPGSKKSAGPIRKRIEKLLESDHELDVPLLGVMAAGGLSITVLSALSYATILDTLSAFAAVYGRNRFLAALLVDYREEIRALAIEILSGDIELPDLDIEEAQEELGALFVPLLCELHECLDSCDEPLEPGSEAASGATDEESSLLQEKQERIDELERRLKEKKEKSKREKSLRKKVESLEQRRKKLERDLLEAGKEVAKEQKTHEELKTRLRATQKEKADIEKQQADRISEAVQRELSSVRNRWLKQPMEIEREAESLRSAPPDGDLVARAENVLNRQIKVDHHSGNVAVLRKRLNDLGEALTRVRQARTEALHPLADLAEVEAELEKETAHLKSMMPDPAQTGSTFLQKMLGQINSAKEPEEFVRIQQVLEELDELEALEPMEQQELYRCCHLRMAYLYAAFTPKVVKKEWRPDDPIWQLKNAVAENEPLVLILDGYNVVHLLPGLFDDSYQDGKPGTATRRRLVDMVVSIFSTAPKCRAEVFFDAPAFSRAKHGENVFEVYSGGGEGEHRADRAIMEQVEYCSRKMSAMPRFLVTDDRELRAQARELGTRIVRVPQFGVFLEDMTQ